MICDTQEVDGRSKMVAFGFTHADIMLRAHEQPGSPPTLYAKTDLDRLAQFGPKNPPEPVRKLVGGSNTMSSSKSSLFVNSVQEMATKGDTQKGIVSIYGYIGDLLTEEDFEECDNILSAVNEQATDKELLLSYLMATVVVNPSRLPARSQLYKNTHQRFLSELGHNETSQLLDSLV